VEESEELEETHQIKRLHAIESKKRNISSGRNKVKKMSGNQKKKVEKETSHYKYRASHSPSSLPVTTSPTPHPLARTD
jgi:hypothetical protein